MRLPSRKRLRDSCMEDPGPLGRRDPRHTGGGNPRPRPRGRSSRRGSRLRELHRPSRVRARRRAGGPDGQAGADQQSGHAVGDPQGARTQGATSGRDTDRPIRLGTDSMSSSPLLDVYRRSDVEVVRGSGLRVWDSRGRCYLDFMGGIAVLALGHCPPRLVEALHRQAQTLWHASNLLATPGAKKVARRLVDNSFGDVAFFNNSGSEAVDLAIKLVRRYFNTHRTEPARWRIVTMERGYHGRTLATIAAGGSDKPTDGFEPLMGGFDRVAFGDLAAAEAAVGP
ncbi:MAG: aminotransferase class III-fold pyridoxal phosphate-dependent enzyme, partial [Bauldia sp.]